MALSNGTIAASATPATDMMTQIATALTGAGWVEETTRTYTASIMGTTANCRVFFTAATTNGSGTPGVVSSGIYTGAILSFEIDDTNARIRIRACEKFDSSLGTASAANTKWGVWGGTMTGNQAATANYAFSDSFATHFQATGATQQIAWVEIPCPATGFNYWVGANASRFITFNNANGGWHLCYTGQLAYAGDLLTAVGNAVVFLGAAETSGTVTDGSWTITTSSGYSNWRTSREPNVVGSPGATIGQWWCHTIDGPMVGTPNGSASNNNNLYGGPGSGNHHFYQASFVVFPAWLHGVAAAAANTGHALRSNYATLPEAVVLPRMDWPSGAFSARAAGPNIGELVTVGGTTYTAIGLVQTAGTGMSSHIFLFVDGSQF